MKTSDLPDYELPSKGSRYWTTYRGRVFHMVEQEGQWHAFESGEPDTLATAPTLEGAISAAKAAIDRRRDYQ